MRTITDLKNILDKKWPEATFKAAESEKIVFATGIEEIDRLLPHRGIPLGQMIEMTGPVSSGKTSLLYKILAKITHERLAVYFDLSNSFYPSAATCCGVNIDCLVVVKTGDVLLGLRTAESLLYHGKTSCVILDLIDQEKPLPMTLLHRLRMQTTRSKALTFFLTADNTQIIPSSIVSLRLSVRRLDLRRVEVEVTKSRISKEGLKTDLVLYD
ncbi:MAG: hypothetical protein AB1483_12110 [Candidatus Zixiibacteriota bacterium]